MLHGLQLAITKVGERDSSCAEIHLAEFLSQFAECAPGRVAVFSFEAAADFLAPALDASIVEA
jgi:hypothetical protein